MLDEKMKAKAQMHVDALKGMAEGAGMDLMELVHECGESEDGGEMMGDAEESEGMDDSKGPKKALIIAMLKKKAEQGE